jgi:PAS domain S-box-containing protein
MAGSHSDHLEARFLAGLNALAIDLAAAGIETDPVPLAVDRLRTLTGAVAAGYAEYDRAARVLRLRHMSAEGAVLTRVNQILGHVLGHLEMLVPPGVHRQMVGQVFARLPDLTALTLGAIPRPLGSTLEHVFGVGEKLVLVFQRGGRLFGTATLLMPAAQPPLTDAVLEVSSGLVSAAISRYQAERRLVESEQRFRTIFDAVSDAIFVHDAETGAVLDTNARAAEMFGYSADELRRLGIGPVSSGSGRFTLEHGLARVRAAALGEPQLFEWHCRHKDGHLFRAEVHMRLASLSGLPTVLVVVRDRTVRVEAERAQARAVDEASHASRLESIGRLAGGVAHDFNNLLTTIIGNVELVGDDLGPLHPAHDRLRDVLKAADTAASLTTQLLAFGRKQMILPRVVDPNGVVESAARLLSRLIGEGVQLVLAPAADAWRVRVDPMQFQQVIVDLATNARDAMPSGGRLTIDTANVVLDEAFVRGHEGVSPGRYVRLSVGDTGQGMAADVLPHVFEPFFTTRALGKGTGLGLATVYGAVRQNGGIVVVAVLYHQGARQGNRPRPGDGLRRRQAERRDRGRGIGRRPRHDCSRVPAGRQFPVSPTRRSSASKRGSTRRPSKAGATPRNSISPSRAVSARSRAANARSCSPRPA